MSFDATAGRYLLGAAKLVTVNLQGRLERGELPQAADKEGYAPGREDITTDFDGLADEQYRSILEPTGYVLSEDSSEEADPSEVPDERYVIDAVDGTRSMNAGMYDKVGTMGAAVNGQHSYAAFVGALMTGEMIGFGADESSGQVSDYVIDTTGKPIRRLLSLDHLDGQSAVSLPVQMRRSSRFSYSPHMERLVRPGVAFEGEQLVKGSFGLGMFPLFRGEVAAQVIPEYYFETPWDNTPVFAICKKLGIQAFTFTDGGRLVPFGMEFIKAKRPGNEILLVHRAFAAEVVQVAERLAP